MRRGRSSSPPATAARRWRRESGSWKPPKGRIKADLARRKEALGATSVGAALLREEYGDGGVAADALQSFAEREAILDQIEERVDEELEAQEGALRSIPLGKQYLWEAEQARLGRVEGSPPLAERESIVNTATERVEEEFDRREKKLAANAGNENLLVEVAGDLELDGGTLTLGERWRVLEAARRREEERAEFEALRARTEAARLNQRNRNSVRPVKKSPPMPKPARLVPDATWEDAEPLLRALTDLEEQTEPSRLDQRARHAVRPVSEKTPPVPGPARLVPAATREDAVAAAPLIVRARLPEAEQELRPGVGIAARELADKFRRFPWWSHAGGELDELHWREDRYLEFNDTEIGMLRTVLEKNVYEKAFPLVEHPVAEPDPPTNLVELVRPFIRWLQDAVDRLIDRVLDREPAHPPGPAAAADQVPAPALEPSVAPTEPALRQPVPPAAAASPIVEPPAAPAGVSRIDVKPQPATTTHDEATAEPGRGEASPPPATAPAPEPAALNVTEAERVRVAVDAVEAKLPRTQPYSGNPSHRPPAVSDERLDHLAAAADDEFVKTVVTELQRRQAYYTDSARSESEKTYLHPAITRKDEENRRAYKKADAARRFPSRRQPKPTWAAAESVVIKEFEAEQLVLIEDVCRDIQQWSPAVVRREFQRLEPEQVRAGRPERDEDLPQQRPSESSRLDQTKGDRGQGPARRS